MLQINRGGFTVSEHRIKSSWFTLLVVLSSLESLVLFRPFAGRGPRCGNFCSPSWLCSLYWRVSFFQNLSFFLTFLPQQQKTNSWIASITPSLVLVCRQQYVSSVDTGKGRVGWLGEVGGFLLGCVVELGMLALQGQVDGICFFGCFYLELVKNLLNCQVSFFLFVMFWYFNAILFLRCKLCRRSRLEARPDCVVEGCLVRGFLPLAEGVVCAFQD